MFSSPSEYSSRRSRSRHILEGSFRDHLNKKRGAGCTAFLHYFYNKAEIASAEIHCLALTGGLRHRDTLIQIDILNGIEEFHTFRHRALEGFAPRDKARATSALVDHSRRGSFGKVVATGGAAAVDQTDASHVTVRHLIAA